jgi:hypothetical protein
MELRLNKIYRLRDEKEIVHMAIEATYGWKGEMCRDLVQINYNGNKREAYLTVKMIKPGVGVVVECIIELVAGINYQGKSVKNPPLFIIEKLSEKLNLQYDPLEVDRQIG